MRCNNNDLLIFKSAQQVSGNFLLILKSARVCLTECGVKDVARLQLSNILHTEHIGSASAFQTTGRQQLGCIKSHAVKHNLALLRMSKKLRKTCSADWNINKSLLLHLVGLLHYLYQ